jgi:quercetin dioxygenase-like cupin family protein
MRNESKISVTSKKEKTFVVRGKDIKSVKTSWGSLQWLVSGLTGSSLSMTFGRVIIYPRSANPYHFHPNCEEILYVISGEIEHSLPEGGVTRLVPGDCIVMQKGMKHKARNVGDDDAVVVVAFNSAFRKTIGE